MSLIHTLHQRLSLEQAIPFVDFMHLVLYAPDSGYYSCLSEFGSTGDFITAPQLTPLFGKTLAKQCQEIMMGLDSPLILEYGAGSGRLCIDILSQLETYHCLPQHYLIMEVSASLRHSQEELIKETIPHLASRVSWLDRLPASFNGIILANEVLDAMPVHRFLQTKETILESYIELNSNNELNEIYKPCQNRRLLTYLNEQVHIESYPYQSEVNLFIEDWISNNYQLLEKGVMLIIDYGFPRHEYYHPDRRQGSLMCHYQHQAHTNPLINIGKQDITAHVDFTQVAIAAQNAGFQIEGYTNQASFLLNNDLLSFLDDINEFKLQIQAKQAIKKLIHPSEMGELFKVIALSKKVNQNLNGFKLYDKRASL